jgi:predicted alpha/beta hydrolase family esterase
MKAILIHGFEGASDSNWFPWLEQELIGRGYEVFNQTFPDPYNPDFTKIMSFYRSEMSNVDLVVGHSMGAFIALKLSEEFSFGKLILVAPAIGELNYPYMEGNWPGSNIAALKKLIGEGFESSKLKADDKTAIFSDNDPYVPLALMDLFGEDWKLLTLSKKDHFQASPFLELLGHL